MALGFLLIGRRICKETLCGNHDLPKGLAHEKPNRSIALNTLIRGTRGRAWRLNEV